MLVDAHAHLNEESLASFVRQISSSGITILVISNSVDAKSSVKNIDSAKLAPTRIIPFVGIHPEILRQNTETSSPSQEHLDIMVQEIQMLVRMAGGIGEIGIDPKYGSIREQEILFHSMLSVAEKTGLPVSIHNRDSVPRILEILSTFDLKGSVLLHWFAGSESELQKVNDRRIFISYGPAAIFSKRLSKLIEKTPFDMILTETDSPTPFSSIGNSTTTPFLVGSVLFKISLIKMIEFDSLKDLIYENTMRYLGTQNSLRVR